MTGLSDFNIDGYEIVSVIGKGSIGIVYKATDSAGNPFAVKIMKANPFLDESVLDAITEGALSTSKVSECDGVVKVHKAGRSRECHYIVMDFMSGGTLERIINDKNIPLGKKLGIGLSLSQTIACVHSKGLIHGDLKPGNILLDSEDAPYLTDFYYTALKKSMGTFPQGTPRYMSPEQANGLFITTSSDLYSFGVLLYELLTGSLPYENSSANIAGMVEIVLKSGIIHPSKFNKKLDEGVCAVLLKLLQKKPEDRYQTMQEAYSDLKACQEGGGVPLITERSMFEHMKDRIFSKKTKKSDF